MSLDGVSWPDRSDVDCVVGRSLVDAAVGAVVVVIDVFAEQLFKLAPVPDDGSV